VERTAPKVLQDLLVRMVPTVSTELTELPVWMDVTVLME